MRYCDGASFSGDNETTVEYKGATLHWRGARIRKAIVASLMTKGLKDATDLMVSGCSAGGLATYLHTDQWCDAVPDAKCAGLPDSGFFLDYQDPTASCDPPSRGATALRGEAGNTVPGDYHCGLKWTYTVRSCLSLRLGSAGIVTAWLPCRCKMQRPESILTASRPTRRLVTNGSACSPNTRPSTSSILFLQCNRSTTRGRQDTS
eukprot:SAG31_NODE_651_length_13184_cov_4.999541_4_plen_205_part_00